MDKELIKLSVFKNSNYTKKIEDNYLVPSFIYSSNGRKINILEARKIVDNSKEEFINLLRKDIKDLKLAFQDCYKDLFRYIIKFPIIIEDKSLWNKLLDTEGIDKYNPIREKDFILLDLLFTKINLAISIDNNPIIDRINDRYIKIKYGIDTIRYNKYGESNISRNIDRKYLEDYIRNFIKTNEDYNNTQLLIIPEDTIINNYIIDYQGAFKFIEKLKLYLSDLFYLYDNIILTTKDIYNIDPEDFDIDTNINNQNQYINSIITVLKQVYKKDTYIHNTMKFSLKNVMWIINLINNNSFSWNFFVGKEVPYWIINIIGYPPKEYYNKLYIQQDKNDGKIKKFLEELKKIYKI